MTASASYTRRAGSTFASAILTRPQLAPSPRVAMSVSFRLVLLSASRLSSSGMWAPCCKASLRHNLAAFRSSGSRTSSHSVAQRFSSRPYSLWTAHGSLGFGSKPKPSSILQFLSSQLRSATHRTTSRLTRASSRSPLPPNRPGGSFQPPGSEGGWKGFVRWVNGLPESAIIWGILGLNGIVYVMWNWAHVKYVSLFTRETCAHLHLYWCYDVLAQYRRPQRNLHHAPELHSERTESECRPNVRTRFPMCHTHISFNDPTDGRFSLRASPMKTPPTYSSTRSPSTSWRRPCSRCSEMHASSLSTWVVSQDTASFRPPPLK